MIRILKAVSWAGFGVWCCAFWFWVVTAVLGCISGVSAAERPAGWCDGWNCPPPPATVVRVQAARNHNTSSLGPASPEWTWPGNIYQHLAGTHGVSGAGLSHREAVILHNRLHNAERQAVPRQTFSTWSGGYQQYSFGSSCPGGVCPTPRATVRRRAFFRRR